MITLLTQKDVAERWQVSVKAVENCRKDGIITRVKGVPGIRFSLAEIELLEGPIQTRFSPLERRKLERENDELRRIVEIKDEEITRLKEAIAQINAFTTEFIYVKKK